MKPDPNGLRTSEIPETLVAETVTTVIRLVRDRRPLSATVSRRVARLVRKILRSLGAHDTALRLDQGKFAAWAEEVRQELRCLRLDSAENQENMTARKHRRFE